MHNVRKLKFIFLALLLAGNTAWSDDYIEVDREFSLLTSQSMQGYLKPLFTSIEQGFNSNLYTTARYEEEWSIGMDISIMGMFIPESQKTFDAARPDEFGNTAICETSELRNGKIIRNATGENSQPTIYGGSSTAIYSSPRNAWYPDSTYKTVTYAEGNDITFMSGIPNLQLFFGFPTRTQLRFRYWGFSVQDSPLTYWSIMLNQQVDHFFDIFKEEDKMGIAINFAYHGLSRSDGIDMTSWSLGAHYSYEFAEGLTAFGGLQYEDMSGTFEATREEDADGIVDSPYEEVRNGTPLKFDIETFTNFRGVIGAAYRYNAIELHTDISFASQIELNFGLSFHFGSWGKKETTLRKVEKTEKIKRIEVIEKEEKREEIEK